MMSNRNSNITNYLLPHITKYRLSEEIGSGAYGVVYKGLREDDGKNIALKRIFVTDNEGNNNIPLSTHRELCALKKLNSFDNKNIVRLFDVVLNKIEGKMCMDLIFELGDYDLEKYLNKFNSAGDMSLLKIINLSNQLLDAIHFMHSYCVIHRDLKPANILINRDGTDLKITDFGLARTLGFDASLTPVVVTLWYRSPEILLQRSYLTACDVWSAGCIVAEMIYGRPVFAGENELSQIEKIVMRLGSEAIDNWPDDNMVDVNSLGKLVDKSRSLDCILRRVDKPMIKLVKKLLRFDPDQRILSNEALSELGEIERLLTQQQHHQHQSISISASTGADPHRRRSSCNGCGPPPAPAPSSVAIKPSVQVSVASGDGPVPIGIDHCNGEIDIDDNEMIVHSVVRHVLDDDDDGSDSGDSNSGVVSDDDRVPVPDSVSWVPISCQQALVSHDNGVITSNTPGSSTDSIGGYPRHLQVEIGGHDYCVSGGSTVVAIDNGDDDEDDDSSCEEREDRGAEVDIDTETDIEECHIAHNNHHSNEATDSFSSYRSTNQCSISSYAPSSGTGFGSAEDDEHDHESGRIGGLLGAAVRIRSRDRHDDEDDEDEEIDQIHEFQTGVVISDPPQVNPGAPCVSTDDDSDYAAQLPVTDKFPPINGRLKRVNSTPFKEINIDTECRPGALLGSVHHQHQHRSITDLTGSDDDDNVVTKSARTIRRQASIYGVRKRLLHPGDSTDGSDENELVLAQCSPIAPLSVASGNGPTITATKASMVRRQKSLRRRVSLVGSHVPIDRDDEDENDELLRPFLRCRGQESPFPQRRLGPLRASSVLIGSIPETDEARDISFGEHSLARVLDSIGTTKLSDRPRIVVRRRSHVPPRKN